MATMPLQLNYVRFANVKSVFFLFKGKSKTFGGTEGRHRY
jgi:hypothetical protein